MLQLKESMCNVLPLIQSLQQKRDSHVLVFISNQPISQYVSYKMSQVLRRVGPVENLDVILESGGGSLDSAYKVLKMLKSYAMKVTVIVPFYAKSAASLIAIGANELMMCKSGELGPIDPQVHDPQSGLFIPAHSIKEAIAFIEETKDNTVKLSLADKIPVLLIGAYREAGISSKQYLKDVLTEQYDCVKDKITETFTERFLSHGYPMDRDFLEKTGIKVTHPLVCSITPHQTCP